MSIIDRQPYKDACITANLPIDTADAVMTRALAGLTPTDSPLLTHMLGIPAAGKSTYVLGQHHDNTLILGFDRVMESLPDYQRDHAALGAVAAFVKWEVPARMIGYEILHRACDLRLNILFDHGGTRRDHVDFLHDAKLRMGYRVRVVYVPVDPDIALERLAMREARTGRHTPPHYVPERFATLNELLPLYRDVADDFITQA